MRNSTPHLLLDTLMENHKLRSDAALARLLEVAPPVISKIRHRKIPMGDSILLRTHDITGVPVRELLALRKQSN